MEKYIQILLTAYKLSILWQKCDSSIADVIPSLLKLINDSKGLDLKPEAKELCLFLIHFVKIKFKYEFSSEIYKVWYLYLKKRIA